MGSKGSGSDINSSQPVFWTNACWPLIQFRARSQNHYGVRQDRDPDSYPSAKGRRPFKGSWESLTERVETDMGTVAPTMPTLMVLSLLPVLPPVNAGTRYFPTVLPAEKDCKWFTPLYVIGWGSNRAKPRNTGRNGTKVLFFLGLKFHKFKMKGGRLLW